MSIDTFVYEGRRLDRDGFRALLRQRIDEVRADPKSPYRDSQHPQHAEAVQDMNHAYRWLSGELTDDQEYELAIAVNEAIRGGEQMANEPRPELKPVREMNRIMAMP